MSELAWVEKYRPQTLSDMVLSPENKKLIQSYFDKNTICNLLLVGRAGIGKTTLAKIIPKKLNTMELYINCGQEGNVDTIRTKVYDFCQCMSLDDTVKVVILDEADSLSMNAGNGASAQGALRNLIEEAADDTRFILTGNFINKIMEPIQSRCTPIKLRFTVEDVLARVLTILDAENIKYGPDELGEFVETIIKRKFPDVRTIINNLEHWCVSGTMTNMGVSDESDMDEVVTALVNMIGKTKPREIRQYMITNSDKFSNDYEMLGGALFNRLEDGSKQLTIAESLYRMAIVLDKEIEFYSMILNLTKV